MKSFLLSSFKHRLGVFSAVSLLLFLVLYGLSYVYSIDNWRAETEAAIKWTSGQKERCELLFRKAEEEIQSIDKGRCEFKGDFRELDQCRDSEKKRRAELVQVTSQSDCPTTYFLRSPNGLLLLTEKKYPDPLPIFALESMGLSLEYLPIALAGLVTVLMLLSDFAKRVITESNAGWKRLSIVGSLMTAAIVAGLWLHEGGNGEETFLASIMAFCIAYFALVYSRTAYKWIADGFASEKAAIIITKSDSDTADKTVYDHIEIDTESKICLATDNEELTPVRLSTAQFWPRLWARCIDLTLCWLLGSVAAVILPDIRSIFPGVGGVITDLLLGMAFICSAVFLYEWQFVSRFGATPGKMLLGISVSSIDGGLPSSEAARYRAWIFLKSGLYFCFYIPILQILGAISAWRRKNGSQPWDMAARTFTGQRPISLARYFCVVLLAFCMVVFMVGISKVAKEITMEDVRRSSLN